MKMLTMLLILLSTSNAFAASLPNSGYAGETIQKTTESQIRRLVEPLLEKYCHEQCKLLAVAVEIDTTVPEQTAPGFDEPPPLTRDALAPIGAKLKLLVDDKVGPISRRKLLDLMQQYLDTLDYPVTIDTQLAHFPQPIGTEGKIGEMRERLSRNFQNTVNELIQQFCPEQCLFTDFDLKTDVVNAEEAQYLSPGEFVQDGGVALKIKDISGTLLIDESLSPEERGNIVEMIKLKTSTFKRVNLTSKTLKFPRPTSMLNGGYYVDPVTGVAYGRGGLAGEKSLEEKKNSLLNNQSSNESKENRTNSEHNQQNSTNNNSSEQNHKTQSNSQTNTNENNMRQERFERTEKIERVENGDAVQQELNKFKVYALIFGCSILSLLIFIAIASLRQRREILAGISAQAANPMNQMRATLNGASEGALRENGESAGTDAMTNLSRKLEIQRLIDELVVVYGQHPRVAKHVFTRVITEEGIETTAQYIHIFGESIVVDMLRDPSLQSDMNELMEFYARTTIDLNDAERLELLRRLHHRTVAGKLAVMGNRSSTLFDFLGEMDSTQILEMIRNESMTVKAIILTQCDAQKRAAIYGRLEEDTRMRLLTELSRIDYLPRDYVFNVANALKRKRRENPRLNTEALPGSEVLVTLLERTGTSLQRDVMKNLETSSPDSARNVKGKLVSIETLRYLRDGQLLEVVLSLRHDELLQFLKGAPPEVKETIFAKSPKELVVELEDEMTNMAAVSRETYFAIERKILNRMKLMANDGLINLVETNERMFADPGSDLTMNIQTGAVVGSIAPEGSGRREAG